MMLLELARTITRGVDGFAAAVGDASTAVAPSADMETVPTSPYQSLPVPTSPYQSLPVPLVGPLFGSSCPPSPARSHPRRQAPDEEVLNDGITRSVTEARSLIFLRPTDRRELTRTDIRVSSTK